MAEGYAWRLGIDEAGYGPNLGPLVVAASAWRAPAGCDLDRVLGEAVTRTPKRDARLLIADSKAVYQPGGGLAKLERAVCTTLGDAPGSWLGLVSRLGADPDREIEALPWQKGFDPALPMDANAEELSVLRDRWDGIRRGTGVGTTRLAARLVFPEEFNRLVAQHGTKGAALSFVSLGLARRLFDEVVEPSEPCELVFDKHGGRNRYGALIQEHFPEGWIVTRVESRPTSEYRLGERLAFRFRSKGEEELPVALASMTAKLLRELSMKALNEYWRQHLPDLKPTAGYPVDAKRFKADIAAKQAELGIPDNVLWRER